MMSRMVSRGSKIVIQLKMGAKNYPDADSFNTVAEIIGSKYPEQVSERDSRLSGNRELWSRDNMSLQRWSFCTYSLQMLHRYTFSHQKFYYIDWRKERLIEEWNRIHGVEIQPLNSWGKYLCMCVVFISFEAGLTCSSFLTYFSPVKWREGEKEKMVGRFSLFQASLNLEVSCPWKTPIAIGMWDISPKYSPICPKLNTSTPSYQTPHLSFWSLLKELTPSTSQHS